MALPLEGVDFAWGRPGGRAIKAAGKAFVVRYVPYNNVSKGLTRTELADYLNHGIKVAMVMEVYAGDALLGYNKGREHGLVALQGMRSVGFPDSVPIYFAVDVDAQTHTQLVMVDAYLRGAASAIGASRVGVYGGVKVIEHCATVGSARWFWQTYAWSYGAISPRAHLYQYDNYGHAINGVPVDLNKAFKPDYGQYPRPGATSPGLPDTAVEDLMYEWLKRAKTQQPKIMYIPKGVPVFREPGVKAYATSPGTKVTLTHELEPEGLWAFPSTLGGMGLVRKSQAGAIGAPLWKP